MIRAKVSVIIPAYNSMNYIESTLESVFNQTYKHIEIIVVDDGSSDGTLEYLNKIENKSLIVQNNEKKGACAARNKGLQMATGDYIQFLDADDILSPNKIEAQVEMTQKFGEEFVYSCRWMPFTEDIASASTIQQPLNKDYKNTANWLNDAWTGKGMGQTAIWLAHRNLISKAGSWNEDLLINQDGEFFSRVLLEAKEIKYSDEAIVYYRKGNVNSISQKDTKSKEKAASLLNSYKLYKISAKRYDRINHLRKGLGHNFLVFIDQYFNIYPKLAKQAENEFYDLGFSKMWPVGGTKFQFLTKILGFKTTLKLKRLLKW